MDYEISFGAVDPTEVKPQSRDDQRRFAQGGVPSTRPAASKLKAQIRELLQQMSSEEREEFIDELDDEKV